MPVRWRLTIWYTAILLLVLFVLGIAVYALLHYSLLEELDKNLENKADEVLKSAKIVGTLPFFLRQVVLPDVEVFAAPDVYLQVITMSGEIATKSNNLGRYSLPVLREAVNEAAQGETVFSTLTIENARLRQVVKPLLLDGETVGFLLVARPLTAVTSALTRLRVILLLSGLGALVVSLALGWFMSGKALSPIRDLTREARTIGEQGDLKRRVTYRGPKDELGYLAITFNQMLANLEDLYQRLAEALSAQQRFVADASHELRTPLTSIQGNVDFLLQLEKEKKELPREALEDIAGETRRLSRLVRELLTLARADSGLKLSLVPTDLFSVLEETIRQTRHLIKGQCFIADIEAARGVSVLADPDYLRQLLLIFLDNAFKYTPPDKNVHFRAERVLNNDEHTGLGAIELIFEDEGPGIPEKELPRLFDRFYRVQPSREGEGSGLGLAIARWIAEQHQVEIKVENREGEGARFSVCFPILSLF